MDPNPKVCACPEVVWPTCTYGVGPGIEMYWSDEGVVEVRNGGEIPAVTGQGGREETGLVVDKVGDDNIDDLQGSSATEDAHAAVVL